MQKVLFYVYVLIIPVLILVVGYFIKTSKPIRFYEYLKLFVIMLPFEYIYAGIVYHLDVHNVLGANWASFTILFFLVPISIIAILLFLFLWLRRK
jgi:hypothetical protein